MITSEQLNELNLALVKVQQELPFLVEFRELEKGTYRHSYLKFEDLIQPTRPILNKHGLAITFMVETISDEERYLICEICHISGQYKRYKNLIIPDAKDLQIKSKKDAIATAITNMSKKLYKQIIGLMTSNLAQRNLIIEKSNKQIQNKDVDCIQGSEDEDSESLIEEITPIKSGFIKEDPSVSYNMNDIFPEVITPSPKKIIINEPKKDEQVSPVKNHFKGAILPVKETPENGKMGDILLGLSMFKDISVEKHDDFMEILKHAYNVEDVREVDAKDHEKILKTLRNLVILARKSREEQETIKE